MDRTYMAYRWHACVLALLLIGFLCGCSVADRTIYHTYIPKNGPDESYHIVRQLIARQRGQDQPLPTEAVREFEVAIAEARAVDSDSPQVKALVARYEQLKSERKPQPVDNSEWPKEFVDPIGIEYVLIPAGEFLMGSSDGRADERPVHKVRISKPFYMSRYEITQAQYMKVMGANPSYHKDSLKPVHMVTWYEGNDFCLRLSEKTGLATCLPTEAQWEYACRAGSTGQYCFGDSRALLPQYALYGDDIGSSGPMPAGSKKPNNWGLYDMHGNIWEWCGDWYWSYPSDEQIDPTGPQSGDSRVLRGGTWGGLDRWASAARFLYPPGQQIGGIRVVVKTW